MLLDEENGQEVANWCGGEWIPPKRRRDHSVHGAVLVPTRHGQVPAYAGDWVIKGTQDEFYPVPQDVKATNYDEASQSEVADWVRQHMPEVPA